MDSEEQQSRAPSKAAGLPSIGNSKRLQEKILIVYTFAPGVVKPCACNEWLRTYFALSLECNGPILKALSSARNNYTLQKYIENPDWREQDGCQALVRAPEERRNKILESFARDANFMSSFRLVAALLLPDGPRQEILGILNKRRFIEEENYIKKLRDMSDENSEQYKHELGNPIRELVKRILAQRLSQKGN